MKKLFYLIALALILSLVLTGCLLSNVGQVPTTGQSGIAYLTKHTEGKPHEIDLIAGGGNPASEINVGDILVWNDANTLYVKYVITEEGWFLTETHLHVVAGENPDLIPQTKKGNPIPGQFEYSTEHDPWLTEYIYEVDLGTWTSETQLYIAAHAVVVQDGCYETVWQIGDVETNECDTNSTLTNYANEFNWKQWDSTAGEYTLPIGDCEIGPTLGDNSPFFTTPFILGTNLDNEFPYNSNATNGYAKNFKVKWTGKLPFGGRLVLSWSPGREGSPKEQKNITIDSLPTFTVGDSPVVVEAEDGFGGEFFLVENEIEFGELLGNEHTINFVQTDGNGTFWDVNGK